MATRAVSGLFPTSWRHSLPRGREARKRCILALIAVVLLASPLIAEPSILTTGALSTIAGADFVVCRYPKDQSRFGLNINGHNFWVHRANVVRDWDGKTVSVHGQLSHQRSGQLDDQIYYTIPFQDGKPQKPDVEIDHGGVGAFFEFLPLEIVSSIKFKVGDVEIGLVLDKLSEAAAEIQKYAAGRGWEGQAGALIAQITITAAIPNYCDQVYYTAETSEKGPAIWCGAPIDGTNNWVPDVGAVGFSCRNNSLFSPFCDNMRLACAHLPKGLFLDYTRQHETGFFSEENRGMHLCNEGNGIVHGIDCVGKHCDKINLLCAPPELGQGTLTKCELSPWLLTLGGGVYNFNKGHVITGVECAGGYCQTKRFRVCHLPDVVTFDKPIINGVRLDWCRNWASDCGKPAADEFCALQGQLGAIGWEIDENITLTQLVSGGECNHPDCDGFAFIQCEEKKMMQ